MERLWSKCIKQENGCWEWQAFINPGGYGMFGYGDKTHVAHRVAWTITNGTIPEGLFVCHKCDNRKCINPEHLFLGTNLDNMQDMVAKGRSANQQKTHCKNGHELIGGNVYSPPSKPNRRACVACKAARQRINAENHNERQRSKYASQVLLSLEGDAEAKAWLEKRTLRGHERKRKHSTRICLGTYEHSKLLRKQRGQQVQEITSIHQLALPHGTHLQTAETARLLPGAP